MSLLNDLSYVQINIASPDKIREWSYGEVTEAETINYRTLRPEKNGLFCERIFGPSKDYQCAAWCGQYKRGRHRGKVCDKCGVEVTSSRVRRERMGHIELAAPVTHMWYSHSKTQNYIAMLLNMTTAALESIIKCKTYLIVDPGETDLEEGQLLNDEEFEEAYIKYKGQFRAGFGSSVLKELLSKLDLDKIAKEINERIPEAKKTEKGPLIKRLRFIEAFRRSGNKPEWMIIEALPVIPPDLRPILQLDGGRFATTDLNDFYRRVINRNKRLKRLIEMEAPAIMKKNEMRMLQESVDYLIANNRVKNKITGPGGRVLKSLSQSLEGKQGRFRQNLLGKRVDYSGRSVITVGPELKLHQCGIPREMAIELFRPFVQNLLVEKGLVTTLPQAQKRVDNRHQSVWSVLEEAVEGHPVMLNRAPSLHRLSIRAFEVKLVEGRAIQLHPLVCSGFNADFDGDQMAVHVPLTREAQAEARVLLLASVNLLHPQTGEPTTTPSQDIVLGCHYLLLERNGAKGEGRTFGSEDEVIMAYEMKQIELHTKIIMYTKENPKFRGKKYVVTTPGKIIFNRAMDKDTKFVNDAKVLPGDEIVGTFDDIEEAVAYLPNKPFVNMKKGFLKEIIMDTFDQMGQLRTAAMLDGMKDVGYKYATKSGLTINLYDITVPEEKQKWIEETDAKNKEVESYYNYGQISDEERYNSVIGEWTKTGDRVTKRTMEMLGEQLMNPIRMMIDSGARGSSAQYTQLSGMRNLMASPSGKIIEKPVRSNFLEGLTVLEFFISSHGARKGLADTSLKTANSGYLTRRMVDVSQDVVVTEEDCGTHEYDLVREIGPEIEKLENRIKGRFIGKDMLNEDGSVWLPRDTYITEEMAKEIVAKVDAVPIRNLLKCETQRGVCRKCYGQNPATRKIVDVGEAVGIIAAQSIGEPGTQLTMRTFHTGGVAAAGDITQGLPRIEEIFEARKLDGPSILKAVLADVEGVVHIVEHGKLKDIIITTDEGDEKKHALKFGHQLQVREGDRVTVGQVMTNGPINTHELLRLRGMDDVQHYILEEVQKTYVTQGVDILDKHIEIIIRQMTRRVTIKEPGGSKKVYPGYLADRYEIKKLNRKLEKEGKEPVTYIDVLQGITQASSSNESFLSAASFQETSKALTKAAVSGTKDYIRGLKEAVITGKKIPAGTGFKKYDRNN